MGSSNNRFSLDQARLGKRLEAYETSKAKGDKLSEASSTYVGPKEKGFWTKLKNWFFGKNVKK